MTDTTPTRRSVEDGRRATSRVAGRRPWSRAVGPRRIEPAGDRRRRTGGCPPAPGSATAATRPSTSATRASTSATRASTSATRPSTAATRASTSAAAALLACVVAVGAPAPAASQQLPEGVTAEMVERGRQIFRGDGFCYTCHGRDGSGMSGAGGDLTDREWRHTDGSFQGIAERIRQGVRANASTVGVPMPPAGGAELSAEQIRAVAAYVWTLSRGGG